MSFVKCGKMETWEQFKPLTKWSCCSRGKICSAWRLSIRVASAFTTKNMFGGSAGDALELISRIFKAGFSLAAMQHATVEEEQPGKLNFEEHNMKLANT